MILRYGCGGIEDGVGRLCKIANREYMQIAIIKNKKATSLIFQPTLGSKYRKKAKQRNLNTSNQIKPHEPD